MKRKHIYLIASVTLAALLILTCIIFLPTLASRFNTTKTTSKIIQKSQKADQAVTPASIMHFQPIPTQTVPPTVIVATPTVVTQTPATSQATANQIVPGQAVPGQRIFTFVNHMQQTIWVAAENNPGHLLPQPNGWVLPAGSNLSINIPDSWNGRFWGRTGCTFDGAGNGSCATGDCGGHLQCNGNIGALPATLAEVNLNSYAGQDFYDVSLVDGSNLPMYINTFGRKPDPMSANGCTAAGCTHNVNDTCPAILQEKDAGNNVIACKSACKVFGTNQYCCRTSQYGSAAKCNPAGWPVDYARVFKTAEPFAYSYSFDDATSTFTCSPPCNYRVTFGVTGS